MVVMPSKLQSGLYFGELTSDYCFESAGPNPYYHWRSINWFSGLIPRTVYPPGPALFLRGVHDHLPDPAE